MSENVRYNLINQEPVIIQPGAPSTFWLAWSFRVYKACIISLFERIRSRMSFVRGMSMSTIFAGQIKSWNNVTSVFSCSNLDASSVTTCCLPSWPSIPNTSRSSSLSSGKNFISSSRNIFWIILILQLKEEHWSMILQWEFSDSWTSGSVHRLGHEQQVRHQKFNGTANLLRIWRYGLLYANVL